MTLKRLLPRKRMTKILPRPRNWTVPMTYLNIQQLTHVTVVEILVIAAASPTIIEARIGDAAVRIGGHGRIIDAVVAQASVPVVTTVSEAGDAVGVGVGIEAEVVRIVKAVVDIMTTMTGVMRQIQATHMITAPTDTRDHMILVMILIMTRIAIKIMCIHQCPNLVGHLPQRRPPDLTVHTHRHHLQIYPQLIHSPNGTLWALIRPLLMLSMRKSGHTSCASWTI
mmetsp:Transcript_32168/g.46749  ORF Transcript_32168/g.46749 Transcript_32168/m.46749 type:complete len:225 (-) Transcript_32168:867-1541(-)